MLIGTDLISCPTCDTLAVCVVFDTLDLVTIELLDRPIVEEAEWWLDTWANIVSGKADGPGWCNRRQVTITNTILFDLIPDTLR